MIQEEGSNLLDLQEFDEEAFRAESEELLETRYLTKENAVFSRTAGGFAALAFDGRRWERVYVYRMFPLSDPERFLSIREADEKAKEIGIVENLADFPKEQADILHEQLNLRYFTPVIEKILDVKDEYGHAYFHVQTNFGVCRFTTRMGGDAVTSLSDRRVMFTDLDGNRYEIPDIYKLTAAERKKLDLFI
ncbi:MAG: DUF1854 domain-containing protein [Lachnospiraceae bacterium]|nr:DUF1854 domain-containing protein [Lachnospiraceae bacterium]